jgi:phosphoglycerate dehydrogenase-like enzyme
MRVLYHGGSDQNAARELGAEELPLDDLLRESDFVSIHVPLNKDTYHLISARELALMKPTAVLVNTARGGVVDPAALYEALRDKRIFAAALDVTEPEPIKMDDPLLTLDNCLIVPHIGSATVQTRTAMATLAAKNLLAALRGEKMLHSPNSKDI